MTEQQLLGLRRPRLVLRSPRTCGSHAGSAALGHLCSRHCLSCTARRGQSVLWRPQRRLKGQHHSNARAHTHAHSHHSNDTHTHAQQIAETPCRYERCQCVKRCCVKSEKAGSSAPHCTHFPHRQRPAHAQTRLHLPQPWLQMWSPLSGGTAPAIKGACSL